MSSKENNGIRRVILLGRKEGASDALSFLLAQGVEVPLVVAKKDEPLSRALAKEAPQKGIPVFSSAKEVYELIHKKDPRVQNIDLVISYLFWGKIEEPLLSLGKKGCVNFHPAPLPDYKGRAGYNTAILDERKTFGVSAHFIDSAQFDVGPIIDVLEFPFDAKTATALSLERESQTHLFTLFTKVLHFFLAGKPLPTKENNGGVYLTGPELEKLKVVNPATDTAEEVEKKVRAFFFPPYSGAKITIDGKDFTLIDESILNFLAEQLRKQDNA